MKETIVIPIYLIPDHPEALTASEALQLAKRAIESLKVPEDQGFTLILPSCIDVAGAVGEEALLGMDQFVRKEVKAIRQERTLIFSSPSPKNLRGFSLSKDSG